MQSNSYLWVCFAMIVGVMGTALASPLYPLYQQAWQLSTGAITILYVVYMASALSSLLFLGRISDQRGFIIVLRGGLILVTTGIVLSTLAWDYWSFMLSRIAIGLASSLIVTSASIGLTKLNRSKDLQRAAATSSLLIAFGFGLGPVIGGLIAQWLPYPLRSSYVPSILMGLLAIYALFIVPNHAPSVSVNAPRKAFWRPSLYIPAGAQRLPFLIGALNAFTAFAMFSLFASLAPSFMNSMVPWHGPAVSGLSIGVILFLSSGFQLLVRQWPLKRNLVIGLSSFFISNILLALNTQHASPWLFISCLLLLALGHGLCLIGGMSIVNRVALPEHRAATTSSYLVIAYFGAIIPILGMGYLADQFSMTTALFSFCFSLSSFSAVLLFFTIRKVKIPHQL
ncbi:MFS transporter [Paenalcaligenes hominis]|uniref:MFS transporter n=1 Tax=Paenalcaligenes hominis TaxID=643674 RepID=A0A1U9K2M4_9BURK|nr:MFS transporter [Paenalcaligenes hominis]